MFYVLQSSSALLFVYSHTNRVVEKPRLLHTIAWKRNNRKKVRRKKERKKIRKKEKVKKSQKRRRIRNVASVGTHTAFSKIAKSMILKYSTVHN